MENQNNGGSKNKGKGKLKALLNAILEIFARKRVNGDTASHSTATTMGQVLHTCFSDLNKLGFRLEDPKNLGNKHVEALCQHWYGKEMAISTIQGRLSVLRIFAGWIDKPGMVKSLPDYLPNVDKNDLKVRKAALTSKSWTGNGIDVLEKIRDADALDKTFGQMVRMILAFGLRRMEVIQLRPHKSDMGNVLRVYHAKNGRQRDIDIETVEQRAVLDQVKNFVKSKVDHMGWKTTVGGKEASLQYSIGRYNKSMAAIGITRADAGTTGHGLRAQYAENAALIAHMIPPTLGGTGGQMARDDLDVLREQVSEKMGHSRKDITNAYYGSFGREVTLDDVDRCKKTVESALQYCRSDMLKPIPEDRMADCIQMVAEMSLLDVEITPKQIQLLWQIHSERHATKWVTPLKGNASAIEAAAIKFCKKNKPKV